MRGRSRWVSTCPAETVGTVPSASGGVGGMAGAVAACASRSDQLTGGVGAHGLGPAETTGPLDGTSGRH